MAHPPVPDAVAVQPLLHFAEALVQAVHATGVTTAIQTSAPACWETGLLLTQSASLQVQILGYTLVLEAMLRTPEVMPTLLQHLCAELAGHAPVAGCWSVTLPSA